MAFKIKDGIRVGATDVFNNSGTLLVNSPTASKLETARTISISGDVTGNVSFDGSQNVDITATIAANSVALGTDTTGSYVATVASSGGTLSVTGSGSETAAVNIDLPNSGVTAGQYGSATAVPVLTVDAQGRITLASTATIVTSFTIAGDTGTPDLVSGGETLTFVGTDPIDTAITGNTVTISAKDATTTTKGVASFAAADFSVTSGAVSISNVNLGTQTTGNYVATIAGTANQVTVSGSGSETAAVTLSLPQNIHTGASPTFAGATLDAVQVGITAANEIDTSSGNLVIDSAGGTVTIDDNLIVSGNLTVNGTTTTVNSTVTTVDDPVITLGGDNAPAADDGKDRGVEFRWHNGTSAKIGFFGFDDSTQKFTFIPDATNTSEVFSGTKGTIDANIDWADVLNKPDPVVTVTLTGDVTGTGNATLTDLASGTISFATTIAANSVALGTDTTGNYVATISGTTNQVTVSGSGSETAAITLSLPQDIHAQATPTFSGVKFGVTGTETALDKAVTTTLATTTTTAIDSFAVGTYRSAKYVVQITQGTNYQVSEVLVIHNGTTTFMTEYGVLETNGSLATFSSDISAGNARLLVTMASATSATINIKRTALVV